MTLFSVVMRGSFRPFLLTTIFCLLIFCLHSVLYFKKCILLNLKRSKHIPAKKTRKREETNEYTENILYRK